MLNKGNNKITELRTILQRESQNSYKYINTKSVNNRKTVKKMIKKKYHAVGTVTKSNQKIVETETKSIHLVTYMTTHWLGTLTSIQSGGV